jgi:hypothetical protein
VVRFGIFARGVSAMRSSLFSSRRFFTALEEEEGDFSEIGVEGIVGRDDAAGLRLDLGDRAGMVVVSLKKKMPWAMTMCEEGMNGNESVVESCNQMHQFGRWIGCKDIPCQCQ